MIRALDAVFVKSGTDRAHYPDELLNEVAFAGRSNVGKSSMINALAGRRKLVRVSNTPGRTRTLNFFDIHLDVEKQRHTVRLCDLPGYGFARVSKTERELWKEMITRYFDARKCLKAVVVIVDAEVGPTDEDEQMLVFAQGTRAQVLVAATKMDRLSKSHRKPRVLELTKRLGLPHGAVVGFSATDKLGVDEVWERLWTVLAPGSDAGG